MAQNDGRASPEDKPSLRQWLRAALKFGLNAPESESLTTQLTVYKALQRISNRNLPIGTVIDVGASNGMWSDVALQHYPTSRYLLIEAQPLHEPALQRFCVAHPSAEYVLKAAGDSNGTIFFDDTDPFGGAASKQSNESAKTALPVTTIDHEVAARNLPGPYLIKLDTHGFEVPILEGAKNTLKNANLVVIETYFFHLTDDSLLFWEMCKHMHELGFGVIDMCEPLWREHDNAFWQVDLFFIPLNRAEFSYDQFA